MVYIKFYTLSPAFYSQLIFSVVTEFEPWTTAVLVYEAGDILMCHLAKIKLNIVFGIKK